MPLTFNSVSFSYGAQSAPVLRDVAFTLEDGEFLGVCGATGSGKSTLLSHMNGLLAPTAGTVALDGRNLRDRPARTACRTQVGLVFQCPERQLFRPTVHEDVAFGPRNLGLSAAEVDERVQSSLALVGLDAGEIGARSPFELSGGQQRRVALAGVLAMAPRILALDEPTVGLDPRTHREFIELLGRLHAEEGLTVVMASHNMDDLAELADRILRLNPDGTVTVDAPGAIFADEAALAAIGLDAPFSARFARALAARGFDVGASPRNVRELAEAIAAHI